MASSHGKIRKLGLGSLASSPGINLWAVLGHTGLSEPPFPPLYNVDDNSCSIPLPGVCERLRLV